MDDIRAASRHHLNRSVAVSLLDMIREIVEFREMTQQGVLERNVLEDEKGRLRQSARDTYNRACHHAMEHRLSTAVCILIMCLFKTIRRILGRYTVHGEYVPQHILQGHPVGYFTARYESNDVKFTINYIVTADGRIDPRVVSVYPYDPEKDDLFHETMRLD